MTVRVNLRGDFKPFKRKKRATKKETIAPDVSMAVFQEELLERRQANEARLLEEHPVIREIAKKARRFLQDNPDAKGIVITGELEKIKIFADFYLKYDGLFRDVVFDTKLTSYDIHYGENPHITFRIADFVREEELPMIKMI